MWQSSDVAYGFNARIFTVPIILIFEFPGNMDSGWKLVLPNWRRYRWASSRRCRTSGTYDHFPKPIPLPTHSPYILPFFGVQCDNNIFFYSLWTKCGLQPISLKLPLIIRAAAIQGTHLFCLTLYNTSRFNYVLYFNLLQVYWVKLYTVIVFKLFCFVYYNNWFKVAWGCIA